MTSMARIFEILHSLKYSIITTFNLHICVHIVDLLVPHSLIHLLIQIITHTHNARTTGGRLGEIFQEGEFEKFENEGKTKGYD